MMRGKVATLMVGMLLALPVAAQADLLKKGEDAPQQTAVSFPATIVLNSGEVIEGRIVGQSIQESTITVDVQGKTLTLLVDEIADIKEEREEAGPSTKPMYGGLPRSQAQQAIDAKLIEEFTEEAGSREAASRKLMKVGWEYYDQGDLNTTMKRFNQAWLLNPNNADVFVGFGSVSLAHQDVDEAIDMFKKAIALHPKHAVALCSVGYAYQLKAHILQGPGAQQYLEQSDQAFQQGSQADPQEESCYSKWAVALFLQDRYQEAWEKIALARTLGGKTINSDFLRDLSAAMPEPTSAATAKSPAYAFNPNFNRSTVMQTHHIESTGLAVQVTNTLLGEAVTGEGQQTFSVKDGQVTWYCKLKKRSLIRKPLFRAIWYGPNGRVFKQEDFMVAFGNHELAKYGIAWDAAQADGIVGTWHVQIYYKGDLLDDRTFEVVP